MKSKIIKFDCLKILTITWVFTFVLTSNLFAQGNFCTATSINVGASCSPIGGSTSGLINDPQFESSCYGTETNEGWYWIVGGTNGTSYTIDVEGDASTDVVISIVGTNSASCATVTELDCVDATLSGDVETLSFTWSATYTYYYVQIYEYYGDPAVFTICAYSAGSCTDGVMNGTETGIDCGGSCPPCNGGSGDPNDCNGASVVCTSGSVNYNPIGPGFDDFIDTDNQSGCLSTGEHLSAWYYFEFNTSTPANSPISFDIVPDNGSSEDYDFAVFGPNLPCDNLGSPIRCSYAANGYSGTYPGTPSGVGSTGLGAGTTDLTEGAGGDAYVAAINVNAGEGYWLLVDNYSSSNQGFTLNWGGTAAPFLDCTANPPNTCGASNTMTWD